ncbi:MAG: hypothetical protein RBT25_09675, partial [Lentisphaeria bacterium]|nr:hypothetical protein [Lentisphaeria bacterium]
DEKQAAVYAALGIDLGALPTAKLTTCEKGQRKKECSAFLSGAIPPNAKVGLCLAVAFQCVFRH